MHHALLTVLIIAAPTAAIGQQSLTPLAAEVVFPATSPEDTARMENGSIRFKGSVPGSDSELSAVAGRKCSFKNVDLRSGRITYQVNFGQAEPEFTTRPSRFGYAAIRLIGQGVYCSSDKTGVVCNDVYDITAWGESDLTKKLQALNKLQSLSCFKD